MGMLGLGRIGKTRVEKGSSATVPLNWKVLGTLLFNTVISFFLSLKMFFHTFFGLILYYLIEKGMNIEQNVKNLPNQHALAHHVDNLS